MVLSGWGLACGLQDQRLMARPPAWAGGRSGLLTGGTSGKRNGFSPPFPKGYLSTSPARPAGGRAVTSVTKRGPQAGYLVRSTASPTPPTREGGPGGGTSSPGGSFPHFFPRNGAPAGQAPVPRRSNGVGETPQRAPLREPLSPPLQRREDILHPPSRQSPPAQTKNTAVPHRPRRCFFSARRKRLPQSPTSRSRFTISTALRAQS